MSQNRKLLNTGVSRALRIQNKGVQSVEAHDESPARLLLFIHLVKEKQETSDFPPPAEQLWRTTLLNFMIAICFLY